MSEVTVTVRGEHETRVAPERATIRVSVRAEGSERSPVVEHAMRLTEPVRDSITARKESGVIVDWTSTRLSVRAERTWNNGGKRLAPIYYASIDLTATFTEASELSLWVSDVSPWDGVEVGSVNWHLTPETNARLEREVASEAVGVAVARARAYATALGLHDVEPIEIADAGLIAPTASAPPAGMAKFRGMVQEAGDMTGASMAYEPDTIVITATVEARFVAR